MNMRTTAVIIRSTRPIRTNARILYFGNFVSSFIGLRNSPLTKRNSGIWKEYIITYSAFSSV